MTPLILYAVATMTVVALLVAVDMGYFYRGLHRGAYVENPEWKSKTGWVIHENGNLEWNGVIHFSGGSRQTGFVVLSPADPASVCPVLPGWPT